MVSENQSLKRSIKFKITSKGIRAESETKPCENTTNGNSKRKSGSILECQTEKKQRVDPRFKQQCGSILRTLMVHPYGGPFNEPVDPVKLMIPDYFAIVTQPMDLGTIKQKLEDNEYINADEFASDVRLTFSNAMLYNPPENPVHMYAKQLNDLFSRRWKLLEPKLKLAGRNITRSKNLDEAGANDRDAKPVTVKKGQYANQSCLSKSSVHISLVKRRVLSLEEKRNLAKELVKMSSRKMTEKISSMFQKFDLGRLREEKLDSYIDAIDDETLMELERAIKGSSDAKEGKVKPARTTQSLRPTVLKIVHKDNGSLSACVATNRKQPSDSLPDKCATCGCLACQCSLGTSSSMPPSSVVSSDGSFDCCVESKPDRVVKYPVTSHTRISKIDSDGHESVSNEDNQQTVSSPSTTAATDEGWTSLVHMSPNKALRAAMLKSRFADTIFKATHQTLLDHGKKINPANRVTEREKLERQQREEKARIDAAIRAAEAISRRGKEERERDREAARIALEKMGRSVYIDDNVKIFQELEAIMQASCIDCHRSPLERLGLYSKDDCMEEVEQDEFSQVEEGEIIS